MNVDFAPRGDGWRTRGRPPRQVPEELMELLRTTYRDETQAVIPTAGSTKAEVAEVLALLKRGAKNLDKRLRFQSSPDSLRFYVEDK